MTENTETPGSIHADLAIGSRVTAKNRFEGFTGFVQSLTVRERPGVKAVTIRIKFIPNGARKQ